MNYKSKIILLVAIASLVRLFIANAIELGNDEVYYWTYALHLQTNYFDHPPMVGWLIRLTTANLLLHSELFVRLGAVISSAVSTVLIYKTTSEAADRKAGWYAALLYTASVYGSIIAGTFILPDSPQMVFWLWSILLLLKISKLPRSSRQNTVLWIWFGISAGLCMMSKVHGIFLWVAVLLYSIFINGKWLKYRGVYIAAFISLLIVSPIIVWNIQNNFISYTYHGSRVSLWGAGIQADSFVRELAGEFFYNNPFNFFILWISVIAAVKGKLRVDKAIVWLVLFCSLPLIVILIFISLFKDTLPHWSCPAYSTLIILAAIKLAGAKENRTRYVRTFLVSSLAFIGVLVIAGVILINHFPGTISWQKTGTKTGDGDPTLDMYGWKETGSAIDSVIRSDAVHGVIKAKSIIISKWFPAAHIDFYIAYAAGLQTYGLGNLFDLHHYFWLNQYKKALNNGDDAYYIVPSNAYNSEEVDVFRKSFKRISSPVIVPQLRGGKVCRYFYVYRLYGFHSTD